MEESNVNANLQKPAEAELDKEAKDQMSTHNTAPKQPSRKRRLVVAICLIVIIGLAVTAVFIWTRPKAFVSQKSVVYNQTKQFLLPGPSAGSGISLQKPVELTDCGSNSKSRACYYQYISNSSPHVVQAEIDLSIAPIATPVTDLYLNAVNETLIGPVTSDNYKAIMVPINMFVNSNVGQVLSYKLGATKPFTNSVIKNNAWQFNLTVTPKDSQANSTAHRSSYNGKVIYAIGKQTTYYASIMDIDYNWQGNQPTWQKVLDSLKIDQ